MADNQQTTKAQAKRDLTFVENAISRYVPDRDHGMSAYYGRLLKALIRLEEYINAR